jgi:hypothetical protein
LCIVVAKVWCGYVLHQAVHKGVEPASRLIVVETTNYYIELSVEVVFKLLDTLVAKLNLYLRVTLVDKLCSNLCLIATDVVCSKQELSI